VYRSCRDTRDRALRQSVLDKNGRITLRAKNGALPDLTTTGLDYSPNLSGDKTLVVFGRKAGPAPDAATSPYRPEFKSQLWISSTSKASRPSLLLDSPITKGEKRYYMFSEPRFSPDNRAVYFVTEYSATAGALWRVNLSSTEAELIKPNVIEFGVILDGALKGDIIASKRAYKTAKDGLEYPWYPFFLLDPNGREIRQGGDAHLASLVRRYSSVK